MYLYVINHTAFNKDTVYYINIYISNSLKNGNKLLNQYILTDEISIFCVENLSIVNPIGPGTQNVLEITNHN